MLTWSLTWKHFGPLHHAHHLLPGQPVEAGQQVVGGVGPRVVVAGVHLFGLDQLQHAADGGRQKRCDPARPVGHQGGGGGGVELLLRRQVSASGAAGGSRSILRARQVLTDTLQLPELLGLSCCGETQRPSLTH